MHTYQHSFPGPAPLRVQVRDFQPPHAFNQGLDLIATAASILKRAKILWPHSRSRQRAAIAALKDAELKFRIAKTQVAELSGYPICRCTWPPQTMLFTGNERYQCPQCGWEQGGRYPSARPLDTPPPG